MTPRLLKGLVADAVRDALKEREEDLYEIDEEGNEVAPDIDGIDDDDAIDRGRCLREDFDFNAGVVNMESTRLETFVAEFASRSKKAAVVFNKEGKTFDAKLLEGERVGLLYKSEAWGEDRAGEEYTNVVAVALRGRLSSDRLAKELGVELVDDAVPHLGDAWTDRVWLVASPPRWRLVEDIEADADALAEVAEGYTKSQSHAKAAKMLKRALDLRPDDANAAFLLGATYLALGEYEKSIRASEAALRLQPTNASACYNIGAALGNLGRSAKAIEMFKRALEIRPDLAEAREAIKREMGGGTGSWPTLPRPLGNMFASFMDTVSGGGEGGKILRLPAREGKGEGEDSMPSR